VIKWTRTSRTCSKKKSFEREKIRRGHTKMRETTKTTNKDSFKKMKQEIDELRRREIERAK